MEIESHISSLHGQPNISTTKRISKLAQPISLAIKAASLLLFVTTPQKPYNNPNLTLMYNAHLAFLCLSFFTGLGLSIYSVIKSSVDRPVWNVQIRVMVMAIAFLLISFVMRSCVVLSRASLELVLWVFLLGAGGVVLLLSVGLKSHDFDNFQASEIWEYGSSLADLVRFIGG